MAKRALEVAQDALNCEHMRFPRSMHVETDLLDSIRDIWSGEVKILQSTHQIAILCAIGERLSICDKRPWHKCLPGWNKAYTRTYLHAKEYPRHIAAAT
jgi:hypothetical protein